MSLPPQNTTHPGGGDRPTRVRHLVVAACALMAVLLYLDRFCVGLAEPYIKQDLGLSTFQVGLFFSAFFLTYALFQVPSGWLSDRYGARLMLSLYILAWSLFTGLMGLAYGFAMLILMRAAYGIGQAGAYPTSASVLSKWVPFGSRGTASGIVALGGRFGGAIAPALTAWLIVLFVPVAESSLLAPDDLLDGAALCSRLSPDESTTRSVGNALRGVPPDPRAAERHGGRSLQERSLQESGRPQPDRQTSRSPAVQHVWEQLDPAVQARVAEIAADYRPIETRRKALEAEAKVLQGRWRFIAAHEKSQQAEQHRFQLEPEDRRRLVDALNGIIRDSEFHRTGAAVRSESEAAAFDALTNLDRAAIGYLSRVKTGEQLPADEAERFNRLLLEAIFPDEIGKVYVGGWRPVMILYGLAGLAVAGFFWFAVRDRPEKHPFSNAAEAELIAADRPVGAPGPHGKAGAVPWGRLLGSGSLWFSSLSQVGTNIGWVFLVTWFPRYLLEQHNVPILERGLMASVPLFVGWLGMISGGPLTDRMVRVFGLKWGRRLPWGLSRFLGVAAFVSCPLLETPWGVTAALALVALSTDLGTASAWAFCQDVGGRYVGSVLGWGNMWGNLGAAASPVLLAWVFENHGWDVMFFVCAAAFLAAGLFAFGIDATVPIAPPEDEDAR